MSDWKKSGPYSTIEEFFRSKGLDPRDLLHPSPVSPSSIDGLETAANLIFDCIDTNRVSSVYIVGDYDADGITATAILVKLLRYLGVEPQTIIPRRFTDGYGISEAIVADIHDSLIITVDNGISAVTPLQTAKDNGNVVVVLDHHLPGDVLPVADVIVDPHICPEKNGFVDYCGAGLAYKLAEYMVINNGKDAEVNRLFADITVLAAIGTIADVMPMVGDNRRIIKAGLDIIRGRGIELVSPGIRELLLLAGDHIDEDSVKYKIGPLLNAPGRLYNGGSTSTLKAVLCDDYRLACDYAGKIHEINERRRDLSAHWLEVAIEEGKKQQLKDNLLVVHCPGLPEGLTGLVAGKLAEESRCVTFVFTSSKENPGVCKGSGRSFGDIDISGMLPRIKDIVLTAGGHAGAAGVSVSLECFDEMVGAMQAFMDELGPIELDDAIYYDLVLDPENAAATMDSLKRYAPYGEGVPKPNFLYPSFECCENRYGDYYRVLGSNSDHLKLFGPKMDAIGFHLADDFCELGNPSRVDLIGCVGENIFNGCVSLQFEISDLRIAN